MKKNKPFFPSSYVEDIVLDEEYSHIEFLWWNRSMVLGRDKKTGRAHFFYRVGTDMDFNFSMLCEVTEKTYSLGNVRKRFANILSREGLCLETKETEKDYYEVIKRKTTKVKFLLEKDSETEVFAYFPMENHNTRLYGNTRKVIYAHNGQHSSAMVDYAKECKPATPEQYADLKHELENYGPTWREHYNLQICK